MTSHPGRGGRLPPKRSDDRASSIDEGKRVNRSHGGLIQKGRNGGMRRLGTGRGGVAGSRIRHDHLDGPLQSRIDSSTRKGRTSNFGRLSAEDSALLDTECYYSPMEDVVVRLKETEVVIVKNNTGELTLNSGGWKTLSTFYVITESIRPLGLWLEESENGHWRVSDGRSYLATFQDNMVVKYSTGSRAQQLARGSVIMQHLQQVKRNLTARLNEPITNEPSIQPYMEGVGMSSFGAPYFSARTPCIPVNCYGPMMRNQPSYNVMLTHNRQSNQLDMFHGRRR